MAFAALAQALGALAVGAVALGALGEGCLGALVARLGRSGRPGGPARALFHRHTAAIAVAVAPVVADIRPDLGPGRVAPRGRRVLAAGMRNPAVSLVLLDRRYEIALSHPRGAGDAERRSHRLQLVEQHPAETASGPPAALGRRVRGAGDFRRDVGGVAQWIPSLDRNRFRPEVCIGGRDGRGCTRVAQASRES